MNITGSHFNPHAKPPGTQGIIDCKKLLSGTYFVHYVLSIFFYTNILILFDKNGFEFQNETFVIKMNFQNLRIL